MTVPSTGISSNIGGPQQMTPTEVEATAWTQVNKAGLAIMKDSLEIPFSQMGGQIWKYKSDSSRPTLMPMTTDRTTVGEEEKPDESWKSFFDDLVNDLHPELRKRLMSDKEKPMEFRDRKYAVFENVLKMTAKGMSWLEGAKQPTPPDSPMAERSAESQALGGKALLGAAMQGKAISEGFNAFLKEMGPNFENFDKLLPFAKEFETLSDDMNAVLKYVQGSSEPPDQQLLQGFSDKALALSARFNSIFRGNDLQMMGPMLESMAAVASALSMTPAAPTLFLGLKMATMGMFDKGELAMLGPQLQALLSSLGAGVAGALMKKAGSAKELMMMMMMLATMYGGSALAALVRHSGLGRYPSEDEGDEREGREFTECLLMEWLTGSRLLRELYRIIAAACGTKEKEQELTAEILELATLVMMTLAGSEGKPEHAAELLAGVKDKLGVSLEKIEAFLLSSGEVGSIKGLDIGLKQAKLALAREDYDGLVTAARTVLSVTGGTPETLGKEMGDIKEFALLMEHSCAKETIDSSKMITGMITGG